MKKIIFTLLTVATLSHAGILTYMEASDASDNARTAKKTAQENKKAITTINDGLKNLNIKVKLMNDSIHVLNVKLDSVIAQNAEILEYLKLNMRKHPKK
jgi:peptidoglycan hydrolase CwlO-like protein